MKSKSKTSILEYVFQDGSYTHTHRFKGIAPTFNVRDYTFAFALSIWVIGDVLFQVKVPLYGAFGKGDAVVTPVSGSWMSRGVIEVLGWFGITLVVDGLVTINTDYQLGDVRVDWNTDRPIVIKGSSRHVEWVRKIIHESKCVGWSCNLNIFNTNKGGHEWP